MGVVLLLGIFLAVVCTLFILDPGPRRPGIQVPGIGQPSPALIAFFFYFVVLFILKRCDFLLY